MPVTAMTISESTIATMQSIQGTMTALTALSLTDYQFPSSTELIDLLTFDFIIIGSGAGGSVVANRLSEDPDTSVLLIEAGEAAPLESVMAGLFPLMTTSSHDWKIPSINDSYANQYLQNNVVEMTSGKVLGGCSSLDHAMRVLPSIADLDDFATAANDDSYTFDNMLEYYKKSENLQDEEIRNEYPCYHGTEGPLLMKRDVSEKNVPILAAFEEAGNKLISDVNPDTPLGYNEPLLLIGDVWRQSAAAGFLKRSDNRNNLYVLMNTLATKININCSNVATGVEILTSDGTYKTVNARKEVIVSCGALKSPQLLMLSGIGPQAHLEEHGIESIADLPVGENLMDHVVGIVAFTLNKTSTPAVSNPVKFPTPMTAGYVSLDGTNVPTYQSINLFFGPDNAGLPQLCVWVFKYKNIVCEPLYNANVGTELLFSIVDLLRPKSRGFMRLNSADPTDNLQVYLGHLSDPEDLETMAKSLQDVARVVNTTQFREVNSEIVDFNFPECVDLDRTSLEYWKCQALCTSATLWHYTGTCAIGTVLDNNMLVKGVENLRVVDGSVMPYIPRANVLTTIYALAEKAADLIKKKWNLDCFCNSIE